MMMTRTGIHLTGTLRYVDGDDERYSVYHDADGNEVFLAHGTGVRLVDLDDLDIDALWREWLLSNYARHSENFWELVSDMLIDPDEIDDAANCTRCHKPEIDEDGLYSTNEGDVCEDCLDLFTTCLDCEERHRNTTTTLHDDEVCDSCRERNYSYCEHCDGYYHDDCGGEHDHRSGLCCESPAQSFSMRNEGDMLANDTRVSVTLPAGVISEEGLNDVSMFLRVHAYNLDDDDRFKYIALANQIEGLGDKWQTKEGNYTKRMSRLAYKVHGLKVSPEVMSQVGTIARNHSTAVEVELEITRDLNQSAEEFAHEDSCWWQSYYQSRCVLKTNGGFGLRSFEDGEGWTQVTGRAWVMPLQFTGSRFKPTFNSETPDAFVVFNGYGNLEGYNPARLMAHMTGMTYRKVEFTGSPMYINNESGYLIAPEEIAEKFTDGYVGLSLDIHSNLFRIEQQNQQAAATTAAACNHFEPCDHEENLINA